MRSGTFTLASDFDARRCHSGWVPLAGADGDDDAASGSWGAANGGVARALTLAGADVADDAFPDSLGFGNGEAA